MKKHFKFSRILVGIGFDLYEGCVVDSTLPIHCFRIVCNEVDLVECNDKEDFLSKNPLIKIWMDARKRMVKDADDEHKKSAEWSNRP